MNTISKRTRYNLNRLYYITVRAAKVRNIATSLIDCTMSLRVVQIKRDAILTTRCSYCKIALPTFRRKVCFGFARGSTVEVRSKFSGRFEVKQLQKKIIFMDSYLAAWREFERNFSILW